MSWCNWFKNVFDAKNALNCHFNVNKNQPFKYNDLFVKNFKVINKSWVMVN